MMICSEKMEELICREIDREYIQIEERLSQRPELDNMFDSVRKRFERKMTEKLERLESLGQWNDKNKNNA